MLVRGRKAPAAMAIMRSRRASATPHIAGEANARRGSGAAESPQAPSPPRGSRERSRRQRDDPGHIRRARSGRRCPPSTARASPAAKARMATRMPKRIDKTAVPPARIEPFPR